MRPVSMALFPAFAGVSETTDGGNSRKGKHTKGLKKAPGEIKASLSGPGRVYCLRFVYPFVSQSSPRAAKASGKGSALRPGGGGPRAPSGARVVEFWEEEERRKRGFGAGTKILSYCWTSFSLSLTSLLKCQRWCSPLQRDS